MYRGSTQRKQTANAEPRLVPLVVAVRCVASSQTVASNMSSYDPFGPLKSWTFGNGQVMQRNYNPDGQLDTYTRGSASVDINYNLTGTVKEQLDASNAANDQSYGYDALNRLTHFNSTTPSYTYDPNGNRESAVQGSTTKDYLIDPASNLLQGIDALTFTYDALGNTLNDSSHSYQYDERNRLNKIDAGTANELRYIMNALGQRVAKLGTQSPQPGDANGDGRITRDDVVTLNNQLLQRNTAGGNPDCNQDGIVNTKDTLCINTKSQSNITNPSSAKTYYAYDEAAHLIGEYDANGNAIQETIWFQDQAVAAIKGKNLYYIHTDHLNTPRAISDKNKKIVWTWNSEPFGSTPANEDPDGDGEKFVYNLRFPGQVYDQESGLYYNYFRTYNPATGRYTQSDPIGLAGGLNTFAYVDGNPLYWIDLFGLEVVTPTVPGVPGFPIIVPPVAIPGSPENQGWVDMVTDLINTFPSIQIQCVGARCLPVPAHNESEDAQAPGCPTQEDGFIPKKNWDGDKVKNPNGPGYGFPDEKGRVWVPTGPGSSAHGGPHWDVQIPGRARDYINVYPGGKTRPGRK